MTVFYRIDASHSNSSMLDTWNINYEISRIGWQHRQSTTWSKRLAFLNFKVCTAYFEKE